MVAASLFVPPSSFPNPAYIFYFSKPKDRIYACCNGSGLVIEVTFTINTFHCIYLSDTECEEPIVSYEAKSQVVFYDKSV